MVNQSQNPLILSVALLASIDAGDKDYRTTDDTYSC